MKAGVLEQGRRGGAGRWAAIAVPMLVSASLVVFALTRPLALSGAIGYDEGVYFGAALRFAEGTTPYRDFVLVHPPGIVLLGFPFAVLSQFTSTADGLIAARILTEAVAVVNVGLIGYVLRRHGPVVMFVTAMLLAVHPFAVVATHTISLDPWMLLFCLSGLVAVFDDQGRFGSRRRLLVGGLLLGLGVSVKLWGLLFLVPVLVTAVVRRRRSIVVGIGGGSFLAFAAIAGWFILAAPSGFVRDVVRAQLGREGQGRWQLPFEKRLSLVLGLDRYPFPQGNSRVVVGAIIVVGAIAIVVLAAIIYRRLRDSDLTFIGISALASMAFLLSTDFYYGYTYIFAAALILGVGTAIGLAIDLVRVSGRWRSLQKSTRRSVAVTMTAVLAVMLMGVLPVTVERSDEYFALSTRGQDSRGLIRATIPPGACVAFEYPSALIVANRYLSDDPGCPKVIDPLGSFFSLNDGQFSSLRNPAICDLWLESFAAADYVVTQQQGSYLIAWCDSVRAYLSANFQEVASDATIKISQRRPTAP